MKPLDDLVAVLQVGTRRTTLPPMEMLPTNEGESPEKRSLVLSGALDLMSRAGAMPTKGVPPLDPCPAETSQVAKSAEPLLDAISASMTGAVLEWAAKAHQVGKVAPPAVLVKLLPLVQKHPAELLPTIGSRGRWLAALQGLNLESTNTEDLSQRRIADPDAYREWLAAEVDSMDWKERAQAVSALRPKLSLADEPLLEEALTDRRKEVREPACELLASMPGSRVARELATLAAPLLRLEKSLLRKNLAVTPPEPASLPKWLPKTASRPDFGPKALALFDILRHIPPSKWATADSPNHFLELAGKTDYARAITDALQESAVRFEDRAWIDVLFEFLFTRDARNQACWADLTQHVSELVFDRVISAHITREPSAAPWTLTLRKQPMPLSLSRAAISALRTHQSHHYALRELAAYLHAGALSLVEEPYSDEEQFESTRQSVRKVLDMRRRLLASLDD